MPCSPLEKSEEHRIPYMQCFTGSLRTSEDTSKCSSLSFMEMETSEYLFVLLPEIQFLTMESACC